MILIVAALATDPDAWPLYPSLNFTAPLDIPGYYGKEEIHHWPSGRILENVTNVSLTPFLVNATDPQFTGTSVIVAPGGAYNVLSWDGEGVDIAMFLNSIGVSAFVLKYRVPHRPWLEPGSDLSCCPQNKSCCADENFTDTRTARGPLIDAQRAFSVVRHMAPSLGLNASRVGFIGFSAGGHLGAQLMTTGLQEGRVYPRIDDADDEPNVPDFSILVYPAYLVNASATTPSERSISLNVTADHPPTLLIQSEDGGFSYGSIYYYLALKAAGATSDNPHSGHQHELHQYPDRPETAKHGYGRCTHPHVESDVCQWPGNAQRFMQALGLAK